MKTYHSDANTSGITKIALKKNLNFFDKEDKLAKLQKSAFQSHFSTSKIVQVFMKKKIMEVYQLMIHVWLTQVILVAYNYFKIQPPLLLGGVKVTSKYTFTLPTYFAF